NHPIDFWTLNPRVLRILYVPCNQNELYLCMMAPRADTEASALPVNKDIWIKGFPELAPVIRRISDTAGRYDVYQSIKLDKWSARKVAILGDAAHAMPPTLGQGAGCAMMNAVGLAVALSEASSVED